MGWVKDPEFGKQIDVIGIKHVRKIALRILSGVVQRSPVDTGRLRGNWLVGIDSSPTKKKEVKGTKGEMSAYVNTTEGKKLSASKLKKIPRYISIKNNLPYAVPIEQGHGGRNPGVMVAATMAKLKLGS